MTFRPISAALSVHQPSDDISLDFLCVI